MLSDVSIPRQTLGPTARNVAGRFFAPESDENEDHRQALPAEDDIIMPDTEFAQRPGRRFLDVAVGAAAAATDSNEPRPNHDKPVEMTSDSVSRGLDGSVTDFDPETTREDGYRSRIPSHDASMPMGGLTHPNGAPIFPDLSAEQEVTESSEAATQAEGSIVADSDVVASVYEASDGSDTGYETDSATNATTSLESSVRDFLYENGRRYHRFREGHYNFPNDEMEQEREDMKHAMVKLLCSQRLSFAPIGDYPQKILDIGTGTGVWAIESRRITR